MNVNRTTSLFEISLRAFVDGEVLVVSCPDARIEAIWTAASEPADCLQDAQEAKGHSFWFLPAETLRMGRYVFVHYKTPGNKTRIEEVKLGPGVSGGVQWDVRLSFNLRNSANPDVWGVSIQPCLELLSAANDAEPDCLPPGVLDIALEITRPGAAPLKRTVPMMSPLVKGHIAAITQTAERFATGQIASRPSQNLTLEMLIKAVLNPENSLNHVAKDAMTDVVEKIETNRKDAHVMLAKLRNTQGVQNHDVERGSEAWRRASPTVVAQQVSTMTLHQAGLVPLEHIMWLDQLQLRHGSVLRVANVPENVILRVSIGSALDRPYQYGAVRVQHDELTWLDGQEKRAKADYHAMLAGTAPAPIQVVTPTEFSPAPQTNAIPWVAELHAELASSGVARISEIEKDVLKISSSKPVPDWLAEVVHLDLHGIVRNNYVPLDHADIWSRDEIYPLVRSALQGHVLEELGVNGLGWVHAADEGTAAHTTLQEADAQLSKIPGFAVQLLNQLAQTPQFNAGNATSQIHIKRSAEVAPTGRMAALLLVLGAEPGTSLEFRRALENARVERVVELASRYLGLGVHAGPNRV